MQAMATVGINFGAATSGQGFNVATTVASITALSSAIENPWKSQLTSLQAQDTALTSIGTDLATLTTAVKALTDPLGVAASKEGSSSDNNVLTLTSAGTSAVAGSHTIVVNQLAQTASNFSGLVASASDTLSGTVSIQIGTGASAKTQTITIDSSNNTLATLSAAINAGSYGVTAEVIAGTTGSRLLLASNTSGAAGAITLGGTLQDATSSTAIGFSVGQVGQDASLTVDGLPTTSASNTVTTAIQGVTFQLLSTGTPTTNAQGVTTNEPVQVQIVNNNTSIETAVQSFVTAYNTVANDIKTQAGKTSSGAAEPLYGDPTMSLIQSQLSQALFGGGKSGSISNIYELGITANPDGTLAFDSSTLDSALNSNFSDVVGFLQNTGSWGQGISTTLNTLGTASVNGAISLQLAQNSSTETALNDNITKEDALIATETTNLTTELNTANQELQAIPEQLSEINEIYSAVTGYNQNSNG
jgi:flagellar hook-associated protein 2